MRLASKLVQSDHLVRSRPVMPRANSAPRTAASTAVPTTTVTTGAANTKGSWVTAIASAPIEASGLVLGLPQTAVSGQDRAAFLDIAFGPDSSPVMMVENLGIGSLWSQTIAFRQMVIPLRIPKGSEIIFRAQCATTTISFAIVTDLVGETSGSAPAFTRCETYGANTTTSRGVQLTIPGGNNTLGAWTEITAATTAPVHVLGVAVEGVWVPGYFTSSQLVEIGYGPDGSEQALYTTFFQTATNESINFLWPADGMIPGIPPLPAGVRLAARHQTTTTNQGVHVVLYGYS